MISNELLSEVLGLEIDDMRRDNHTQNWIDYTTVYDDINQSSMINIYELAHKCKEWAYSLGHVVSTQYRTDYSNATTSLAWCESLAYEGRQNFKADTEPEAIFRACEWILQQTS